MLRERFQKCTEGFNQRRREVAVYSADSIIIQRQPGTTELFKKIQQHLPLAERPEEDRHRPDIQGLRAQPEQVADDALHFGHDRPHVLRALRYGHADQFFNGANVGVVVRHGADVIQPVRMRNDLRVMQAFGKFLHPAVQIAHVGNRLGNAFAVQFQHDAQDSVGAGMLRPHVEQQFGRALGGIGFLPGHEDVPLVRGHFPFGPLAFRFIQPGKKIKRTPPALAFGWKILSQGMAFLIIFRQENSP